MIISILLLVVTSFSEQDSIDFYINKGMNALYVEDYGSAKCYVQKAIELDTTNPLGYFAYTAIFRLYSSDFVTDSLIDSFFLYAERTIEKANCQIKKKKKDGWAHFFIAGINMYFSSLYIEKGNFLKSLGFAEKSVKEIGICLNLQPELYDAYLLKGSYEYLKGSFPLWSRYKNKGIENVKIASRNGKYFHTMAENVLCILLQRERKFDDAIEEAKKLTERYPGSRTFLWTLSKAYLGKENWNKAIEVYESLLENILSGQPGNVYNIVQAELALATCYYNIKDYEKCIEFCKDIFEVSGKDDRTEDMMKEAKKMYDDAKRNLREGHPSPEYRR